MGLVRGAAVELSGRVAELWRVLRVLPRIERARAQQGPGQLVSQLRAEGARQRARKHSERLRLRRAIARVDALFPDGGNCYRRALLELALDGGAAGERFSMGFRAGCQPGSGHAWLGAETAATHGPYDAVVAL